MKNFFKGSPSISLPDNERPLNVDWNLEPEVQESNVSGLDTFIKYVGKKPVVLLILDGWGIGPNYPGNAVLLAKTPNLDRYWMFYPHTQLEASGKSVGLPYMVDGNSETGHLNIGAGSIVYQDLARIDNAIADGTFDVNKAFLRAFNHVKQNNSVLHLMGLVGQGFVHSSMDHLYALLNLCAKNGIKKVYLHAFSDGRDSPPNIFLNLVPELMKKMETIGVGQLASFMGRYFAMDRDKRWDRIEKAYDALTIGAPRCVKDPIAEIKRQYQSGLSDEFLEPVNICGPDGKPMLINDNDAVIFFNFRVDRPRELTRAFVMKDFEKGIQKEDYDPYFEKYHKTHLHQEEVKGTKVFKRKRVIQNLYFVTMTTYDKTIPTDVAFGMEEIKNNLGHILSVHGMRQLRISENEKKRMITYYISGQREELYPGEDRIIFPSKGAKSYAEIPEMSLFEVTNTIIKAIEGDYYDAIIANLANGDMVGHTGVLKAGIKACEYVDYAVGKIVNAVLSKDGIVFITADHGNVEEMINMETNEPDTEHSIYPVPFIIISNDFKANPRMLRAGILADIVPTMLHIMGIPKPEEMMGSILM